MVVGIDLGTTNSAIATIKNNGQAEVLTNRDGERVTPSVVMFEEDTVVIGEQAKENSIVDTYSVCQFVKRQMGKKAFSFDLDAGDKYTAEEISALILKRLKEDAEAATGEEVTGAVITVPAYFDDAQRKATQDAGEIAGINVLGIINEPTAAALAYCHEQDGFEGNIMVFDLGGGTFDITIMSVSDSMGKVDILATTGNRNLGGFDFENGIITKVNSEFLKEYGIDLGDDDVASQDLRLKAETAKKALSSRPKASISVASQGHALKVEITREEFEDMIKGYVESTKASMEIAMEDAELKWGDITKILLVGGSTRIPVFQKMIKEISGIEPSHELNPDEAVAIGAAFYADSINGEKSGGEIKASKNIKVTDVCSHSLGIETVNSSDNYKKENTIIIKRNTPLPAHGCNPDLSAVKDYQENLGIKVLEGEDEDPNYDTIIGQATFEITPRLKKDTKFEVTMNYDENGLIHVFIKDLIENKDLGEIHIERTANLTSEEVTKKTALIGGIDIE